MKHFVDKLYFDKIKSIDRNCDHNRQIVGLVRKVNELEDKLVDSLSEEDAKTLYSFMDAFTELASVTVHDIYAHGFRQGSQFTYETILLEEKKKDST